MPTFSSHTIEYNFYRIRGLSEKFVYFNDDMFIINSVSSKRFFKDELPCDIGGLSVEINKGIFGCCLYMALDLIRENFNKKEAVFTGFINHHLPQGYLKKTYEDVWVHCEKDLHRTCSNKFRTYGNVAPWLLRYWQLASGIFSPYNVFKDGKNYAIKENRIVEIIDCIRNQKKKIVCLNDNEFTFKFEEYKQMILEAFEKILPDKCSYEL